MRAILLSEKEAMELEYLIKSELEEMREDYRVGKHSPITQCSIKERYNLLLKILIRFGPQSQYSSYFGGLIKTENNFDKKC